MRSRRRPPTGRERFLFAALAVAAFALVLRVLGLGRNVWLDEVLTLGKLAKPTLPSLMNALRHAVHPPLYPALLGLWASVSDSEPFLRLLSVALGLAAVIMSMLWVRLYSHRAAVTTGLLLASAPIMLRYSQELRDYALLMLTSAGSFYLAGRAACEPGRTRRYVALSAALSAVVLSHLVGVMVVPAVALFLVMISTRRRELSVGKLGVAFIPPAATFCLLYFWFLQRLDRTAESWWMPRISSGLVSATTALMLGFPGNGAAVKTLEHLAPALAGHVHHLVSLVAFASLACLVALGDWRRNGAFLAAAVLFVGEVVAYSLLRTPIFWPRTLIPALIPLAAFVGLQIDSVPGVRLRTACLAVLGALVVWFTSAWVFSAAGQPIDSSRQVAQLLAEQWSDGDIVVVYPSYYAAPLLHDAPGLRDEDIAEIGRDVTLSRASRLIERALARPNRPGQARKAFLIVWADLLSARRPELVRRIAGALASRRDHVPLQAAFVVTSGDAQIVPELGDLAGTYARMVQHSFGPPASRRTEEGFRLLRYR